jgi:hypothetical protein
LENKNKNLYNFSFINQIWLYMTLSVPAVPTASAAGVYLPEGRHPIIPFSQHSIIPVVSAANLSSHLGLAIGFF